MIGSNVPSPRTLGWMPRKPGVNQPGWGRGLGWWLLASGHQREPAPDRPGAGVRLHSTPDTLSFSPFRFHLSSRTASVPVEKGDTTFPVALAKATGRRLSVHLRRPDHP